MPASRQFSWPIPMNKFLLLLLCCALPLLGACAAIQPAQMRLPSELGARAPEALQGLGGGREGRFSLGGEGGSFRRGMDRLVLMDVLARERASSSFEWRSADGHAAVQARCRGRQSTLSAGVLSARVQPFALECRFGGALQASLNLAAPATALGTRAERNGRFETADGKVLLELRSVHEVQGSSLPLAVPIGYTLWQAGRPVGAIELNGGTLRLWRPADGDALQAPVTLAALALALLWDPAQQE